MTNPKKLTGLLADVLKASATHQDTWATALRAQGIHADTDQAAHMAVTRSVLDYRRAVSQLFKAVLGRCPTQAELEAIDPHFEVRKDD
jgi:hypothetical protein